MQEMALIDLKESIDYTRNVTNVTKLDFVGYSMGTTMLFMLLSEYPQYNDKIRRAALLAPLAYAVYSSGIVPELSPFDHVMEKIMSDLRVYEFPPRNFPLNHILSTVCDGSNLLLYQFVCPIVLDGFTNTTSSYTDRNLLGHIFKHYPEPSSVRSLLHFYQFRNTGDFKKYDYGRYKNLIEYGSSRPPYFNLSMTKIPLALYWSNTDELVSAKDVRRLRPQLENVVEDFRVPVKYFQHGDFTWGKNVNILIYKRLLKFLSSEKL